MAPVSNSSFPRFIALLWGLSFLVIAQSLPAAEAYSLAEPATDVRPRTVAMQVEFTGKVVTDAGVGKTVSHKFDANAAFRFLERRLSGAGRDAEALRSARSFEQASMQSTISDRTSTQSLPQDRQLIVVHGRPGRMLRYCLQGLLTRDTLDLLDMPGDPLALLAMLPQRNVEVGETWSVPDWGVEMLASLEAVSSTKMSATLKDVTGGKARVEFEGSAVGARLGANTKVDFTGHFLYDLEQQLITSIDLTHIEKAAVGTITPGIDSQVHVTITRTIADSPGPLTDQLTQSIPLEPPADQLNLVFDASQWGLQLLHGRGWHVFHANFDSNPQVVILRLLDEGTLISQCNFSPVPDAAPGEFTPLEEYEESIQSSLGAQFGAITSRDKIPTTDGRHIFRVTTQGKYNLPDGEETRAVPMNWIYYLCAAPSGKQVSFVFAVEPALLEKLAGQDRQIVESLQFIRPGR